MYRNFDTKVTIFKLYIVSYIFTLSLKYIQRNSTNNCKGEGKVNSNATIRIKNATALRDIDELAGREYDVVSDGNLVPHQDARATHSASVVDL